MIIPEIVAPASGIEGIKTAFLYGADAVYIGVEGFNLRARASNLSPQEIPSIIDYVRSCNKKIYFAINSFFFEEMFPKLKECLDILKKYSPDALIISDIGLLYFLKEHKINIPIHISTQANICNSYAAKFLDKCGVKRIILARELSLEDIKNIRKSTKIELEIFVHGAMCISYSGRCLLSSFLRRRSGNKGECFQPCRSRYQVQQQDDYLILEEDPHGSYLLSSKDLCLLPYLDKIIEVGINGWKIEGRTKSLYYLATTVRLYRDARKILIKDKKLYYDRLPLYIEELEKISNRGYSSGFLFDKEPKNYGQKFGIEKKVVAQVIEITEDKIWIKVKNKMPKGEYVVLKESLWEDYILNIEYFFDKDGRRLEVANTNQIVFFVNNINTRNSIRSGYLIREK